MVGLVNSVSFTGMNTFPLLCVVDDTADYRVLVQYLLNRACPQHALSLFADGQLFLDALPRLDYLPDLILLDYHMPGLDGYQLLGLLKQHPTYCRIPVVVMSAGATEQEMRACYQAGANAFMDKAGDFDLFRAQLAATCQYWLGYSQRP